MVSDSVENLINLVIVKLQFLCNLVFIFTHSHTMTPFDAPGKQTFENTVGKGEIARNEQFFLFPQCFLLYRRQKLSFLLQLICRLQMLSIWTSLKFCRLVMG